MSLFICKFVKTTQAMRMFSSEAQMSTLTSDTWKSGFKVAVKERGEFSLPLSVTRLILSKLSLKAEETFHPIALE